MNKQEMASIKDVINYLQGLVDSGVDENLPLIVPVPTDNYWGQVKGYSVKTNASYMVFDEPAFVEESDYLNGLRVLDQDDFEDEREFDYEEVKAPDGAAKVVLLHLV